MRSGYASLAVVGVAATVAVVALNAYEPKTTTLNTITAEDMEFMKFVTKYGKSYATKEEYEFRAEQFKTAYAAIKTENTKNDISYRVGVNRLADLTPAEYKRMLGYKKSSEVLKAGQIKELDTNDLPTSIDWREKGAVNGVKDQGQCGSCWAFSTIAAVEGHHFQKSGKLESLSEQQLVDCSKNGNEGCNGGDMALAMEYAETNGLMLESEYPYEGVDGTCHDQGSKGVLVADVNHVPVNSSAQLKAAIANGVVSVAIEADTMQFQFYNSGVFNNKACGTDLDHGVAAVGYGVTESGQEYYIVRNSWGAWWGEQGYIRIAIADGEGICGIQMDSVWLDTQN